MRFDRAEDDARHFYQGIGRQLEGRIGGIGTRQRNPMPLPPKHLERAFSVDINHNNIAVRGCEGTIYDRKIAIEQAGVCHRITGNTHEVDRRPVRDQ